MKIKTLLLLAILFSSSSFSWSQYMMMTLDGTKQGKFKGESNKSGYSDKIEVLGYVLEVKSPKDIATGQATGKRQYQPITIWKTSGASSPQFFKALAENEIIKTVTLEFYKPDDVFKREELYYKIELTNVFVSGYKQIMGSPSNEEFKALTPGMYDEVKLVFEKIKVTQTKAGITAEDNWKTSTN